MIGLQADAEEWNLAPNCVCILVTEAVATMLLWPPLEF